MNGPSNGAAGLPPLSPQDQAMLAALMQQGGAPGGMPPVDPVTGLPGGVPPVDPALAGAGAPPPLPPELAALMGMDPNMGGMPMPPVPGMPGMMPQGASPGLPSTDPATYAGPAQQAVQADTAKVQSAAQAAMQTAAQQMGLPGINPGLMGPVGGPQIGSVEGSLSEVPGSAFEQMGY